MVLAGVFLSIDTGTGSIVWAFDEVLLLLLPLCPVSYTSGQVDLMRLVINLIIRISPGVFESFNTETCMIPRTQTPDGDN